MRLKKPFQTLLGLSVLLAGPAQAEAPDAEYLAAQENLSTFQFLEVPFRFSAGPAFTSYGRFHETAPAFDLRCRLARVSLDIGGTLPHGLTAVKNEARALPAPGGGSTLYMLDERFSQEVHFGVVGELPRGRQNVVASEIGLGVSIGWLQIRANSVDLDASNTPTAFANTEQNRTVLSPWIMAGLHLFPTRFYSAILGASFAHYSGRFTFQGQAFNTSLSGWRLTPML